MSRCMRDNTVHQLHEMPFCDSSCITTCSVSGTLTPSTERPTKLSQPHLVLATQAVFFIFATSLTQIHTKCKYNTRQFSYLNIPVLSFYPDNSIPFHLISNMVRWKLTIKGNVFCVLLNWPPKQNVIFHFVFSDLVFYILLTKHTILGFCSLFPYDNFVFKEFILTEIYCNYCCMKTQKIPKYIAITAVWRHRRYNTLIFTTKYSVPVL
jgi:hypothetical protein